MKPDKQVFVASTSNYPVDSQYVHSLVLSGAEDYGAWRVTEVGPDFRTPLTGKYEKPSGWWVEFWEERLEEEPPFEAP